MGSIKATQLDGDLSLGRNLAIGGKQLVQGSSQFKGDVKIDGWLDAKNIKGPFKGYYQTYASLANAHPKPQSGWTAWVGESFPGTVYDAVNGSWRNTEKVPPTENVELADYATKNLLDVRTTEYNVSVQHPFGGINGTNNYTLTGAIALIPVALRTIGLKCSFLNVDGTLQTWEFLSGDVDDALNWEQIGVAVQKELETNLDKLESIVKSDVKKNDDDSLYVTDGDGNIIMKINSNGVQAIEFFNKNGEKLLQHFENIVNSEIKKSNDNSVYISDENGNVIFKAFSQGVQSISFIDKDGNDISGSSKNDLTDKEVVSFGNSLCGGAWENILAQLSGCKYNSELASISNCGGSFSGFIGDETNISATNRGGTYRAKKLIEYCAANNYTPDYIFFENVHDGFDMTKDISLFNPWMQKQFRAYTAQQFYTQTEAHNFLVNNLSTLLAMFDTPMTCSAISLDVVTKKVSIPINSVASGNGVVIVTIDGNICSSSITSDMSVSQIIDKILIYDFSQFGWTGSRSDNNLIFTFTTPANGSVDDVITVTSDCGLQIGTLAESDSIFKRTYGFRSLDVADWSNISYWVYQTGYNYQYAYWKAIIEYLKEHLPTTKMYMCIFPCFSFNDGYTRADGSLDYDRWKTEYDTERADKDEGLRNVARFYNLPIIEIAQEMNITINNYKTYYNANDVHLKEAGNKRIAEIIFNHTK